MDAYEPASKWRVVNEAIATLGRTGWPTRDEDHALAERVYAQWLEQTHAAWANSGYRNREPLRAALLDTFVDRYGSDDGLARAVVFSLLLEVRSREEGHNRPSPRI